MLNRFCTFPCIRLTAQNIQNTHTTFCLCTFYSFRATEQNIYLLKRSNVLVCITKNIRHYLSIYKAQKYIIKRNVTAHMRYTYTYAVWLSNKHYAILLSHFINAYRIRFYANFCEHELENAQALRLIVHE